jgi:hypothetical protein
MGRSWCAGSPASVVTGGPGDVQWGRAEPVLPLADCRQRCVLLGAGWQCFRPACAPSAGLALWAGSPAARGCDGRGATGPGAASLLPVAPRPGGSLEVGDCLLLPGPRAVQVGPVLRPGRGSRVAAPDAHPTLRVSGPVTRTVAATPPIGRSAGRWLQSQSDSGGRSPRADDDHRRRAEPGLCHGLITVSATSLQVQTLH